MNEEADYLPGGSLKVRALKMVQTEEYLNKVKMIKQGNKVIKSMEFIMDGIKIQLPYSGPKIT